MRPDLQAAARNFWTHPELPALFPDYLCAVHAVIRASVPLLQLGSEEARKCAASDPVAALLADYYVKHADEEQKHDEWLLDDIQTLGIDRKQVEDGVPSAAVAALVGAQYYWIQHYHPVALMGYVAVLEHPVDPTYYERVIERTGLPAEAFRTLLLHAELDAGHLQDIDDQLDRLPLGPEQESLLGVSTISTVGGLARIFDEIVETHGHH